MSDIVSADIYYGRVHHEGDGTFTAPPTIITSIIGARAAYTKLRANHLKRIQLYTEIDGLCQGAPPYNPNDLRAAGIDYISNFNDMSARAVIKRACLAYWNLLHNSQYIVNFTIRFPGEPRTVDWARTMSQHWDHVIRTQWPSFRINVSSLSTQLVKFGICPVVFPDELDPRWRTVELNRFFIPDQTQSDADMLTHVMVETEMTVQYLWSIYDKFKNREPIEPGNQRMRGRVKGCPWNLYEIGMLLVTIGSSPVKDSIMPHDMMELERKLYSGDIAFDRMYNDTIRIVSLFQKEYGDKVSHYMFHRHYDAGAFLFEEPEQYNSMGEAFVLFTKDPGEFTIHSNRGLGHEIYSLAQAKIMLDCSVVDMAKWASTPIIKSSSLATKDAGNIRFYPGVPTDIGTAEFVENNLGGNLSGVIGAAQYLAGLTNQNITYSGTDPSQPDPDMGSLSPAQVRLMAFREFSVLKNNIMHFYGTFDRVISNMVVKMLHSKPSYPGHELYEEWKERCVEDGVPREIFDIKGTDAGKLPRHIEVCATRAAGAGSQIAHLIGLQELQAIVGDFGPEEALEFKREFISATLGPEFIDTFLGKPKPDEKAGGASLAAVENAIMVAGQQAVVSPDNEQRAHLINHVQLGQQIIQAIGQQQCDPVRADSIFALLVPHVQQHFQLAAKSKFGQDFVNQIKAGVDELVKYAALNHKNAQRQTEAQQKQQQDAAAQQQQTMSDAQRKDWQAQKDESRKDIKLKAQLQRQEEMGAAKEQMAEKKTDAEIAIKHKEVDGKISAAHRQVEGNLQVDMLQNQADQAMEENPTDYLTQMNQGPFGLKDIPQE